MTDEIRAARPGGCGDRGREGMKHTPGPWRTGWLESYNGATGEPEAFVYRLPPGDSRETAHNRICVRGADGAMDCDADARLIAAAPDLLEALAHVVDVLNDPGVGDVDRWKRDSRVWTARARAAIAKAGGRDAE